MIIYSIIMFIIASLFALLGILIYNGNTNLIHDYHRQKVTDKIGYGKAFGKSMFIMAIFLILTGVVPFLGAEDFIIFISLGFFILGFIIFCIKIYIIQKKYNGGIF